MKFKFQRPFDKRIKGMFGQYDFEVGILENKPHKDARRGKRGEGGQDVLTSYAGGPVRKKSRDSSTTVAEVSKSLRDQGYNYLTQPFRSKQNADILRFTKSFFDLVFGRTQKKRAENLLQAIIRNPILRGEYGPQSELTTKIKGFDRPLMDTAQFFRAIVAKCTVRKR